MWCREPGSMCWATGEMTAVQGAPGGERWPSCVLWCQEPPMGSVLWTQRHRKQHRPNPRSLLGSLLCITTCSVSFSWLPCPDSQTFSAFLFLALNLVCCHQLQACPFALSSRALPARCLPCGWKAPAACLPVLSIAGAVFPDVPTAGFHRLQLSRCGAVAALFPPCPPDASHLGFGGCRAGKHRLRVRDGLSPHLAEGCARIHGDSLWKVPAQSG